MSQNGYAVIWDMDGTLVDTAELHFKAWHVACAELGRLFTREEFAATFGRRNPEIIHVMFGDRFNAAEIEALGTHKEELYRAAAEKQGVEPLPGAARLIAQLCQAGFHQAIGSSAPRKNLELILRMTGLSASFQTIVAMQDTARGKPDPQVFQLAAKRLGIVPANTLVIEDAVAGVEAAAAAGMKCVAVRFKSHHSEDALRRAGAHLIVQSLTDLSLAKIRSLLQC